MTRDLRIYRMAAHYAALKAMLKPGDLHSGGQVWRELRRIECAGHRQAEDWCNGVGRHDEEYGNYIEPKIKSRVEGVFGYTPPGLHINMDPRGYCLKLEANSVPFDLERDWGGYQILAPEFK